MGLAGRPFWSYWCYFSQCRVAGDPEAGGVPLPRRWEMLTKLNAAVSLVIRIGIRRSRMGMAVVVLIIGGIMPLTSNSQVMTRMEMIAVLIKMLIVKMNAMVMIMMIMMMAMTIMMVVMMLMMMHIERKC